MTSKFSLHEIVFLEPCLPAVHSMKCRKKWGLTIVLPPVEDRGFPKVTVVYVGLYFRPVLQECSTQ